MFNSAIGSGFSTSKTRISCTIRPESRSTQTANSCLPSSAAVVSQICLSQTTGDEWPRSWIAVFQRTFFVSLQVRGRSACWQAPLAAGPRNCGQGSSAATAAVQESRSAKAIVRMAKSEGGSSGVFVSNGGSERCTIYYGPPVDNFQVVDPGHIQENGKVVRGSGFRRLHWRLCPPAMVPRRYCRPSSWTFQFSRAPAISRILHSLSWRKPRKRSNHDFQIDTTGLSQDRGLSGGGRGGHHDRAPARARRPAKHPAQREDEHRRHRHRRHGQRQSRQSPAARTSSPCAMSITTTPRTRSGSIPGRRPTRIIA